MDSKWLALTHNDSLWTQMMTVLVLRKCPTPRDKVQQKKIAIIIDPLDSDYDLRGKLWALSCKKGSK